MNDQTKRQLELAAKAAGLTILGYMPDAAIIESEGSHSGVVWAPHSEDGDSRRLQVALRISLQFTGGEIPTVCAIVGQWDRFSTMLAGDPEAATRQVVLRAAAYVGERMP